ncbi:hypothetical protein ASC72_22765 [Flavobacterium sp. Root420]|nr:hypothetical protein ASC72_22765 [Flavobacterium sp. Root420]
MDFIQELFPLSVLIFCFLKKKSKGFPPEASELSGLGESFSKKIIVLQKKKEDFAPWRLCENLTKMGNPSFVPF